MPRGGPRLRTQDHKLNQIGLRVRERRQVLALDQDEVCARLAHETKGEWNPGWQDVSRIENGARTVTDVEIMVLAIALECDASWLFIGHIEESGRKKG